MFTIVPDGYTIKSLVNFLLHRLSVADHFQQNTIGSHKRIYGTELIDF